MAPEAGVTPSYWQERTSGLTLREQGQEVRIKLNLLKNKAQQACWELSCLVGLNVFTVCPNYKWLLCSPEKTSLLLHGKFDGQQFYNFFQKGIMNMRKKHIVGDSKTALTLVSNVLTSTMNCFLELG